MMDGPSWPGVGEYLYQAASFVAGRSLRGGTWMVPLGLSPTWRSLDRTPIAGIEIETGSDRARVGPVCLCTCRGTDDDAGALEGTGTAPAWAGPGWGACCWEAAATPSTLPP